jgi:hypothetical protein
VFYYYGLDEMTVPLPGEPLLSAPLPADRAEALAGPAQPKRRIRKPSLESTVRQVLKAAQAAGVSIAVTIEGQAGKVTATPVKGAAAADSDFNEWDQALGTHPPEVRQ